MSFLLKRFLYHSRCRFSSTSQNGETIVIALGGNALKKPSDLGTSDEMFENVKNASNHILNILKTEKFKDYNLCVTHGNGPQVGSLYLQNQLCINDGIPSLPLTFCGAMTQGYIGYMLQQSFQNNINQDKTGILKNKLFGAVTMINQVGISMNDNAFNNPSKPIGKFYTEEEAKELSKENGYMMKEDSGRGWRITVGSPKPLKIIEINPIKKLLNEKYIVIATGGGGIPIVIDDDENNKYYGMDAVIDKDKTSVLLAKELDANILIIATDGDGIWLNYNDKINRKKLDYIQVDELNEYYTNGMWSTFGGSMRPKIESVMQFVHETGNNAVICDLAFIDQALMGKCGTTVYKYKHNLK